MLVMAEKFFAIVIAVLVLVAVACLLAEFTPLNQKFVVGAASYSGFGVCVLAWKWPRTFTWPFVRLLKLVRS